MAARPPSCPDDPTERELIACTLDSMPEQPPAQFVIERILPRRHVTLLSGHGGSGKSTLALTLAAHVACGVDWGGLRVELGHVVFLSLEDEARLCAWRLRKIASEYGLSLDNIANNFLLLDGVTSDAALAAERNEYGHAQLVPTPAMAELAAAARGASLVVVDNASDALLGDANSQSTVRQFMRRLLGKLARETDAAVLLLAHIDKVAARSKDKAGGQNFIGSVSWHNSARSRIALAESPGLGAELVHEKSNLCRRIPAIGLGFTAEGVLKPRVAPTAAEAQQQTASHANALLACISGAVAQGHEVTLSRAGPCTTQRQLDTILGFPPELRGTGGRLEFWRAINSLLAEGRLHAAQFRNGSRKQQVRLTVPETEVAPVPVVRQSPTPPVNCAQELRTAHSSAELNNCAELRTTGAPSQGPSESNSLQQENGVPSELEI